MQNQRLFPVILIVLALCTGLAYVFMVPPWMHYDEPNHFEYVYLAAKWNRIPKPGDYDPDMRLAVAKSEVESGFLRVLNLPEPNLQNPEQPIWIGPEPQLNDPPLYYLWAGLPLRFFSSAGIEPQLYMARSMSLIIYLATVWFVYLAAAELAPEKHPLRYILPLGVALLPTFVDFMTSVNNNVGEIFLVTVVIYAVIRLLKRGFSWSILILGFFCIGLSYWVKPTGLMILPFWLLAIWFMLLKEKWRWVAWFSIAVCLVVGLIFGIQWTDAQYWYRASSQSEPVRIRQSQAVVGDYIFQVDMSSPTFPTWNAPFYQALPRQDRSFAIQAEYTVGAWMWADTPTVVYLPLLTAESQSFVHRAKITEIPQFYAYTVTLPLGEPILPFHLDLRPRVGSSGSGWVYYDGVVVAAGYFPLTEPPRFADSNASSGVWGGVSFVNIVRNASAEFGGPRVRPSIDVFLAKMLPNQILPSLSLMTIFDIEGAWWFYIQTAVYNFYTFWGRFGWGGVPLLGAKPYRFFLIVSVVIIIMTIGLGIKTIWARKNTFRWELAFLLGGILAVYWGLALMRGMAFLGTHKLFYAPARYAFPAILPTMLLLTSGVSLTVAALQNRKEKAGYIGYIILIVSLISLNYWALISIKSFGG